MKFISLILIAFAVATLMIPGPHSRFGRDVIFYSSDVDEFRLPNGTEVLTDQWYDWEDLLEEKQEFYIFTCNENAQDNCLGIAGLEGPSQLLNPDGSAAAEGLRVTNGNTTIPDPQALDSGYLEFWVCRESSLTEE